VGGEPLEPRVVLDGATSPAQQAIALAPGVELLATAAHDMAMFPGGVTVTDTQILTESETIPRFGANPTITAARSGDWSNPATWSAGRVPSAGDRVNIPAGVTIAYGEVSSARINALEISGRLIFASTSNTRLTVGTVTVMPSGTLQIGTPEWPIAATVKAELVIADQPLDLVKDPRQYGTGLIVLGNVTMHGTTLAQTWTGLSAEPRAGNVAFLVDKVDPAWKPGDTLILPDSRQPLTSQDTQFLSGDFTGQWEEVTIQSVVGRRVILTAPLKYDHLGARDVDGVLVQLPHVGVLTRNVIVRSENPAGTRGHTFYTARAAVDLEYVRFQDLGRTDAMRELDSSTFNASGQVTHVGTNQVGRYAVHLHHLMGPENPTNTGYQFKFIGNTVSGAKKWAVAVHDTSFGLLDQNVVYNAQGAGFVTEDGSEIQNVFSNNFTVRVVGTGVDGKYGTDDGNYGAGGSGFWFRRGGNSVIGNVAADSLYAGFVWDSYNNLGTVVLPKFRGAEKHESGQGITVAVNPPAAIVNNEAYGMSAYGLWAAYINGGNLSPNQPETLFFNLRIWNVLQAGVEMYHTSNVTFRYLKIYGDQAAQNRNDYGTRGMNLPTYENQNLSLYNVRIEGVRIGMVAPRSDASNAGIDAPTLIQNSTFRNYINLFVNPAWDNEPGNGTVVEVRNSNFTMVTKLPPGPSPTAGLLPPANFFMQMATENVDLTQRAIVRVYNFNQVTGNNFQVYFREQAAGTIVPQTTATAASGIASGGIIGAPVAGLTNAQSWAAYRIAIAGAVAPANAVSRADVVGLVAPINSTVVTPRVVLVTPWPAVVIDGAPPLRIRYNILGNLPKNSYVWFSIDNGTPFTAFTNGGTYGIAKGLHTLRAWIGDLGTRLIPGTEMASVSFTLLKDFGFSSGTGLEKSASVASSLATPAAAATLGNAAALTISGESTAAKTSTDITTEVATAVAQAAKVGQSPPTAAAQVAAWRSLASADEQDDDEEDVLEQLASNLHVSRRTA